MSMDRQTKEQARAALIHAALMLASQQQWEEVNPGLEMDYVFADTELTRAVLSYLPHISILTEARP